MFMSKKSVRKCFECGIEKKIYGRGRCSKCYKKMIKQNLPNDYVSEFDLNSGIFKIDNIPWNKGIPVDYDMKEYLSQINSGSLNPNYIHGKEISWNKKARKVYSWFLGRKLMREEVVHHIDGDIKNNEIANLMIFASHNEHLKYHWAIQKSKEIKGRMKSLKEGGV